MSEETIVIHNTGPRTIYTSKGPLHTGASLEVPMAEGQAHMDYPGVVDAAKLVPQTAISIDSLRRKVAALESEVALLRNENEALKAKLSGADAEPPAPKDQPRKGKR